MNHSNFVAPVVPVSRLNKVYSGSSLYLGLFIPAGGGIWDGNLKKYGLSSTGAVLDINGNPAVDATGTIGATVTSIWSTASDGPEVTRGGAGAVMLNQADRNNFYTYLHHSGGLSMDVNSLSKTNSAITPTTLALTTDTAKNDLIDYLRADGVYAPGGTSAREWVMGDVIHSTPAVLAIGAGKNLIFAGANDGFLHCYVDDDKGNNDVLPNETPVYTDDSVKEAWAFVPPELLASLKNTKSELKSGTAHEYFVDGSPLAYRFGADLYLTFGLRGGGKAYYTLKVGQYAGANPEDEFTDGSYLAPVFKWQIGPTVAGGMEPLGQSWCRPTVMKLKTSSSSTTTAVFLTGGYDPNEDRDRPNGDSPTNAPAPVADDPSDPDDFPINADSMGRSVYAVEASNGSLVGGSSPIFSFSHTGGRTAMTHCIVDQTVFDANNDGYADTAYAADLGGNVFVMTDRDANGSWDFRDLFDARHHRDDSDDPTARWLKFFYAPDIVMEIDGEYVFLGSGDRNNPGDCYTRNRFYGIKNGWLAEDSSALPMKEDDLEDVTDYDYADTPKIASGWYIKLETGEKVVSRSITYGGIVVFTTYLSKCSGSERADMCTTIGDGRLYALEYKTGKAAFNFDTSNDVDTNGDGVVDEVLAHTDRYMELSGLPTAPVLIMTKEGPQLLVGTTEGIVKLDLPGDLSVNRYYWKQL